MRSDHAPDTGHPCLGVRLVVLFQQSAELLQKWVTPHAHAEVAVLGENPSVGGVQCAEVEAQGVMPVGHSAGVDFDLALYSGHSLAVLHQAQPPGDPARRAVRTYKVI